MSKAVGFCFKVPYNGSEWTIHLVNQETLMVHYTEKGKGEESYISGFCEPYTKNLYVDGTAHPDYVYYTLMHELLHEAFEPASGPLDEELACNLGGRAMASLMPHWALIKKQVDKGIQKLKEDDNGN